ncbi:MAG: S-adenosylmethionine:tRNA ribosyltransferase-isomerase [Muribaculaceae bacterium]|nr:S-adenosylmethionine:tRNA ribosyltransferase-isomerase [Muribaculaceae bacterium]
MNHDENPKEISISDYDYPLPDACIAKHPLAQRDACRLLVRDADGAVSDRVFSELPSLLPADSVLVYNNTRVINARLRMHKDSGALIEIFCLEPVAPSDYALAFASRESCSWSCFVGNSKRWKQGPLEQRVTVGDESTVFRAERGGRIGNAFEVRFSWDNPALTFASIIGAIGEIPIPPYLNRSTEESDTTDYQTVFGRIDGSVAAPTAGLHFTDSVLEAIEARGIPRLEVTLHVGAGTFQPVKSDAVGEHEMHSEFIAVDRDMIAALASESRRVVAVGTTSVRTLESLYHIGCLMAQGRWSGEVPQWYAYSSDHPDLPVEEALHTIVRTLDAAGESTLVGATRIIIAPGYRYRVVQGMVTNFHQPRSTLLLLVSAFIGPSWRALYDHALSVPYRFLSYGDACLLLR